MANGGKALAGIVTLALLGGGGYYLWHTGAGPLPDRERCTVEVDGHTAELSPDQARYASLIAAVGVRRGLPARAVSIALATAYQESKIANITYGDRDSVGLFQQRPSQGWGTPKQLTNPYYATNAFYDALQKVDGYESMRITDAAQKVQNSGYPSAYAEHEDNARALASSLTGYSPATFTCTVQAESESDQRPRGSGLTPWAAKVRRQVRRAYGDVPSGGYSPDGVTSGHIEGSKHYDGKAIDFFFDPASAQKVREGWSLAQYLVANAGRLHVDHVIYDGRIWSASASSSGWTDYDAVANVGRRTWRKADRARRHTLMHRDHVHVDVY